MSAERMTVSLDDFLKYLLKKLHIIGAFIIVCSVLFVASAIAIGKKIVIPPSEKYNELKQEEASLEDYIENSIVMQMDSTNIYERTLYISDFSDRELLKDFVSSGTVWGDKTQEISVKYLTEIVSWNESETVDTMELKVCHSESGRCEEFAEFLADQIRMYDRGVKVIVGTQTIVMNEAMSNRQNWYLNRLEDVVGQLEYTAAGCTIEVSVFVSMVLGILVGVLLSGIVLFVCFILNDRIRSGCKVEDRSESTCKNKKEIQ